MMNNFDRREFIKLTSLMALGAATGLLYGSKAFAEPSETPFEEVRFGLITDTHLDVNGKNGMRMSGISSECVRRTVADLNQVKELDFVMVTGDLLQDGELENAREIKKHLDRLTMPYYVLAGNHDYIPANPQYRRENMVYLTIEEFVAFFKGHGYDDSGSRYYALEIKPGLRLIALDACLPDDPGKWGGVLDAKQLQWLDHQLTEHREQLNLIFMHHNFIRWSEDEKVGGPKEWFCIDNDEAARALLTKHAKAAPVAFSGHRHIGLHYKEVDKVTYFEAPSLNSHPMRYSVFTVNHQTITWKTPMVSVNERDHWTARENLLAAEWWRPNRYREPSPTNDPEVLRLYENLPMILGSKKIL